MLGADAVSRTTLVHCGPQHGFRSTPVYARSALVAGNPIAGPALIEEHASTTVVLPGDVLVVNRFGILDLAVGAES